MVEMPGDGGAAGLPDWLMPPRMIGGHVTGPVLSERPGGLVVAARQVLAFPTGVEVEVELRSGRGPMLVAGAAGSR
ncbi:MAG: hypothetical protein ACLQDY_29870 [Streptosporangiaceae bacterium]